MRIISFSNASTQPFRAVPVQVLKPWVSRLKNSVCKISAWPTTRRIIYALQSPRPEIKSPGDYPDFTKASEARSSGRKTPSKAPLGGTLRVVRELDSAISPDCAGRMVISGRMADVCAELDRMAGRATTAP